MKPELKAKWVAALRSGEYRQGRGQLYLIDDEGPEDVHEYCCLGVLCRVANLDIGGDGAGGLLAPGQLRRVGLTSSQQDTLTERNDKGEPFSKIADYIEANL